MLTNLVAKLPPKCAQTLKNNTHLVIAFTVLVLVTLVSSYSRSNDSAKTTPLEVDTVIPKGYVLVPLDLQNQAAISSVIQSFGIIDLYTGTPEGIKNRKIAHRIKLIRAPYNPNLFAALVKEALAERIMQHSGTFFAVIQNKTESEGSNEVIESKPRRSIQIEYQK